MGDLLPGSKIAMAAALGHGMYLVSARTVALLSCRELYAHQDSNNAIMQSPSQPPGNNQSSCLVHAVSNASSRARINKELPGYMRELRRMLAALGDESFLISIPAS